MIAERPVAQEDFLSRVVVDMWERGEKVGEPETWLCSAARMEVQAPNTTFTMSRIAHIAPSGK